MNRWRRRALALLVASLAFTGAPAATAAPKFAVRVDVHGARTTRLTLSKPATMSRATIDKASSVYGFALARVGQPGYLISVNAAAIGMPMTIETHNVTDPDRSREALYLPAGSYELTLFSAERRRMTVTFDRRPPRLSFGPSPLVIRTLAPDTRPVWRVDTDFTLAKAGRGFFVLQRDEWTGSGNASAGTCIWHEAPCVATDAQYLASGDPTPGTHGVVSGSAWAGNVARQGTNHVTVESVVAGTPTLRAALVVSVP